MTRCKRWRKKGAGLSTGQGEGMAAICKKDQIRKKRSKKVGNQKNCNSELSRKSENIGNQKK